MFASFFLLKKIRLRISWKGVFKYTILIIFLMK